MKESIELHTVGIFRGKEYEMQELFNGLLEENIKLNNIIKEVREYINTDKNCIPKHIKDYINNLLDKENNNE